jgi:hypothetical protein
MYSIHDATRAVRDRGARYEGRFPEPERFPAELVLRDLRDARTPDDVSRVIARYAALRAWSLGDAGCALPFLEHARAAAEAHLQAAAPDWPERLLLRRLIQSMPTPAGAVPPEGAAHDDDPADCESWGLLSSVAVEAESTGHMESALAARRAAWSAAVHRRRAAPAAELAGEVARLLERRGLDGEAVRWDRVAEWLARRARRSPPSS